MRVPREYKDEDYYLNDIDIERDKDAENLSHKRDIKRRLEDRLEEKRLREEIDDYDEEFDWDELDK